MKQLIFSILIFVFIKTSFGQLNPINNLEWDHWYITPNNYFSLTWDIPNSSQDTLQGYNIYRGNELYRFQTETILNHLEDGSGNCGDDFLANEGGFWIHVTAVYNSTNSESDYVDSVFCEGILIDVESISQLNTNIYPNPVTGKIKIDSQGDKNKIIVVDLNGKIILTEYNKKEIDLSNYRKGIYFIKIVIDRKEIIKKVIIE